MHCVALCSFLHCALVHCVASTVMHLDSLKLVIATASHVILGTSMVTS